MPHSLKYWALDEASKQNQIKHLILIPGKFQLFSLVDSSVVGFVLQCFGLNQNTQLPNYPKKIN